MCTEVFVYRHDVYAEYAEMLVCIQCVYVKYPEVFVYRHDVYAEYAEMLVCIQCVYVKYPEVFVHTHALCVCKSTLN